MAQLARQRLQGVALCARQARVDSREWSACIHCHPAPAPAGFPVFTRHVGAALAPQLGWRVAAPQCTPQSVEALMTASAAEPLRFAWQ